MLLCFFSDPGLVGGQVSSSPHHLILLFFFEAVQGVRKSIQETDGKRWSQSIGQIFSQGVSGEKMNDLF